MQKNNTGDIKIIGLGDISFDNGFGDDLIQNGENKSFNGIEEILKKADIVIANLETPVSERGTRIIKGGNHFRAKSEYLEILKKLNIKVLTLANNHILDYGPDALADTINYLRDKDFKFTGAGNNFQEAAKPVIVEIKNKTIGIIACCDIEESVNAKKTGPTANGIDENKIFSEIESTKKKADIVILCAHIGMEFSLFPEPQKIKMFRKFADAGADIIFGHHPHCPQGFEKYNGKLIFYSLGNFILDDGKLNIKEPLVDSTNKSFFPETSVSGRQPELVDIYPFIISYHKLKLESSSEISKKKYFEISEKLNDSEYIRQNYKKISKFYRTQFLKALAYHLIKFDFKYILNFFRYLRKCYFLKWIFCIERK